MIDDISELQRAYNEAYGYLHSQAIVKSIPYYLQELRKAYNENDIDRLRAIHDEMEECTYEAKEGNINSATEDIALKYYKKQILETLECPPEEIAEILNAIKSSHGADIVLACIESSDWITSLHKKDTTVKKPKYPNRKGSQSKHRKTKRDHKYDFNYEEQLRSHKNKLLKDLNEIGVGKNTALKISEILDSI